MRVNKSEIRRNIVAKIVKAFEESGEKFTCLASVNSQRQLALVEAANLLRCGINLSKSNYDFAWQGNMADMFLSDAAKFIYEKNFGSAKSTV